MYTEHWGASEEQGPRVLLLLSWSPQSSGTTASCPWGLAGVSVCLAWVTVGARQNHRSRRVWEEGRHEELVVFFCCCFKEFIYF